MAGTIEPIPPDDPLNPRGTPDIMNVGDAQAAPVLVPPDEARGFHPDSPEARRYAPLATQALVGPGTEDYAPGDDVPVNDTGYVDNPLNPRGVPDAIASGDEPTAQAMDAQKYQDGYPHRPAATPQEPTVPERVSAGQNRQPPFERIP